MRENLWYRQSMEGLLLRGVGARMTPTLEERLVALGIELRALRPSYPSPVVKQAVDAVAEHLFADLADAYAHRAVGQLFIVGYGKTFVGAAMLAMMRVIGPRLTLERMQRNFRTGTNFIETRFTSLGPQSAQVWFNDSAGMPEFYAGIIEAGAAYTGASDTRVGCQAHDDGSCTIQVDWAEA